eukprot:RCo041602
MESYTRDPYSFTAVQTLEVVVRPESISTQSAEAAFRSVTEAHDPGLLTSINASAEQFMPLPRVVLPVVAELASTSMPTTEPRDPVPVRTSTTIAMAFEADQSVLTGAESGAVEVPPCLHTASWRRLRARKG